MKDKQRGDMKEQVGARRRFLGLLGTAGFLGLVVPPGHGPRQPRELSLKEADFYRDHDLSG